MLLVHKSFWHLIITVVFRNRFRLAAMLCRPRQRATIQGSGHFFHDQMITAAALNGKGRLPPR